MPEHYDPPLVHLPGTKLTPEVVLHRALNKLPHIKSVVVLVQWENGTFATDWSFMSNGDFSRAALTLQADAMDVIRGRAPPT